MLFSSGVSSQSDEDRYLCGLVGTSMNYEELQGYLDREPNLELTKVMDGSGYTLLHLAAYRNSFKFAKLIIERVRSVNL